ncbi:MAG TPA: prepilin-type N-terminal cleavage/methylation domain-containing protein [Candidatus Paceibacterota bacterium]|nr:prepilin-type N-terminal cleavage/methylation domain-containing protein [Candidatus Pacearchaeota archaeon]HRZ51456.1 prepilin-type N-terminal cleavage/methylation domain-containing protein [Candidatus Paceibacterota bacterium]HSA37202.1 prepilin-type N-terminal cleavage/methylation domain-containing protein [Candidatus Paceibacterota bacterium]
MSRGFTLIETLIYLALLSLIFFGLFVSFFAIVEGAGRAAVQNRLQDEGGFLLAKIGWAMNGAESVVADGSGLQVLSAGNTLKIYSCGINNKDLCWQSDNAKLNDSRIELANPVFNVYSDGNGVESMKASFTLRTRTATGQIVARDFETTEYLMK